MKYIENLLHLYSTEESFERHKEEGLISPDSICFLEESRRIYTQGIFIGIDIRVFDKLVETVAEHDRLLKELLSTDEEDKDSKVLKTLEDILKFLEGYNKDDSLKLIIDSLSKSIENIDKDITKINGLITNLNDTKVDKIDGKGLSTNDFTNKLRDKLDSLNNYDDSELKSKINKLTESFDALVHGNPTMAIENFNEVIKFLEHISDKETLRGIIAGIETQIANVEKSLNNYVMKEEGKGLSTNDFTDELKDKIENVSESVNLSPIKEDELNSILI